MKENENRRICSENDENEADSTNGDDLPPEVGKPTVGNRSEDTKGGKEEAYRQW